MNITATELSNTVVQEIYITHSEMNKRSTEDSTTLEVYDMETILAQYFQTLSPKDEIRIIDALQNAGGWIITLTYKTTLNLEFSL